jgi:hypothetical protein
VRARFERAVAEGDLPANTDAETLTLYVISVMNGLTVQAGSGRSREALNRVVDVVMGAWPG